MVGSLVLVGEGQVERRRSRRALDARDRTACGQVAPPDGLYLMQVDYLNGENHAKYRSNTCR